MTTTELAGLGPGDAVHRPVAGGLCLSLRVDSPAKRGTPPQTASGKHVAHGPGGRLHVATSHVDLTPENAPRLHRPRHSCRTLPTPAEEETSNAQR